MSRFTNAPRGDDGLFPGPAADIQHPAASHDGGEIEHLLRSGHKVVTGSGRPTCPAFRSSVPLFGRCSIAHGVISPISRDPTAGRAQRQGDRFADSPFGEGIPCAREAEILGSPLRNSRLSEIQIALVLSRGYVFRKI